jgi:hypothetical protein
MRVYETDMESVHPVTSSSLRSDPLAGVQQAIVIIGDTRAACFDLLERRRRLRGDDNGANALIGVCCSSQLQSAERSGYGAQQLISAFWALTLANDGAGSKGGLSLSPPFSCARCGSKSQFTAVRSVRMHRHRFGIWPNRLKKKRESETPKRGFEHFSKLCPRWPCFETAVYGDQQARFCVTFLS